MMFNKVTSEGKNKKYIEKMQENMMVTILRFQIEYEQYSKYF